MDLNTAANALRELGHPTRLSIYRELVRAGHEGLPVGELQKHLEIPASTLSHHLSALISAGRHCCKVSDEAAFCLIQRPYISKTLLT
ncbi:helix-turn-helix domain-containing protein, partial [Klebsiella pneumoniae]